MGRGTREHGASVTSEGVAKVMQDRLFNLILLEDHFAGFIISSGDSSSSVDLVLQEAPETPSGWVSCKDFGPEVFAAFEPGLANKISDLRFHDDKLLLHSWDVVGQGIKFGISQ